MSASANLTGDLPLDQREGFYSGPRLKAFGVRQRRTATARKVALRIFGASRLGGDRKGAGVMDVAKSSAASVDRYNPAEGLAKIAQAEGAEAGYRRAES